MFDLHALLQHLSESVSKFSLSPLCLLVIPSSISVPSWMVVPVQKGVASFSTSFVVLVGSSVRVFATSSTVSRISVELSPSTIFSRSRDEPFVEGRVDVAMAGGWIKGLPRLARGPLVVDALRD